MKYLTLIRKTFDELMIEINLPKFYEDYEVINIVKVPAGYCAVSRRTQKTWRKS